MFYVNEVKLNNFRCYSSKTVTFMPKINIIYGKNAVGKTTILESIAYLGLLKSFRDAKDVDLIKNGEDFFFIKAAFCETDSENKDEIIVSYNENGKKVKKNNYIYQRNSDYIGYFNVVTFDPSDLDLVKGAPVLRRSFLNINLSQMDKTYMLSLMKYNKILKKRNEYLKTTDTNKLDYTYLDTITSLLSDEAQVIIKKRREFVEKLNTYVNKYGKLISSGEENIKIEYIPCCIDKKNIKDEYTSKLNKDILLKTTTIGPHRDELKLYINEKEANIYASQGQIRSIVISLKLGLSEYMKKQNDKQIVLLDDVFSELDSNRQVKLLDILQENSQIFITTTEVGHINQTILNNSNLIEFRKEIVWVFLTKTKKR